MGAAEAWGVRGERQFPPNAAIIWGIIIPYHFPGGTNIGNSLNWHGGRWENFPQFIK